MSLAGVLPAAAGPVDPGPFVVIDPQPPVNGFVVYEVGLGFDDGMSGAVASCFATFEGNFNQIQAQPSTAPTDIDREELAAAFDGLDGYDEELDSWFRTLSFPDVFVPIEGGEVGSTTYTFRGGTGGGSMITDYVALAHLVLPEGESFTYEMDICRGGECTLLVPEPAVGLLQGAALLTLVALARRARRPALG